MRLFDFVQQDDRIRRPLDALRQLPAFLVADIAGGEPISFEIECFSMNSDMSKRISDFSLPNRNSARARATSVLPTPVGPGTGTNPPAVSAISARRANAGWPETARRLLSPG